MRIAMGCYVAVELGIPMTHAQQRVAVCFQESTRFQKSRRRCYVECRSGVNGRPRHGGTRRLESDLGRQASSWTTIAVWRWSSEQYSPRRRSRNAEQRVTPSEEEGEASSDVFCEGGVSGDSSRTLRGTAAVKHRSEIDSRVFSNTERTCYQSTTCSAEGAETTLLVGLNTCRTAVKKAKQPNP